MSEIKTAISRPMKWRFHQQIFAHLTKDLQLMDYDEVKKQMAEILDPYFEQAIGTTNRADLNFGYLTIECKETGAKKYTCYSHYLPWQPSYIVPANLYQQVLHISEQYEADSRKRYMISKQINGIFRVIRDLESLQELFPDITFEVTEKAGRKSNVKLASKRLEELNELIRKQ